MISQATEDETDPEVLAALQAWNNALDALGGEEELTAGEAGLSELTTAFKSREESARVKLFEQAKQELLSPDSKLEARDQVLRLLTLYSSQTRRLRADLVFEEFRSRTIITTGGVLQPCQVELLSQQLSGSAGASGGSDECVPIGQVPPISTCDPSSKTLVCESPENWAQIVVNAVDAASVMGKTDATTQAP